MNPLQRKIRHKSALKELEVVLNVDAPAKIAAALTPATNARKVRKAAKQSNTWKRFAEVGNLKFPKSDNFRRSPICVWEDLLPAVDDKPLTTYNDGPGKSKLWVSMWGQVEELEDICFNPNLWLSFHREIPNSVLPEFLRLSSMENLVRASQKIVDLESAHRDVFKSQDSCMLLLSHAVALYRLTLHVSALRMKPIYLGIYELIISLLNNHKIKDYLGQYRVYDLVKEELMDMEMSRLMKHPTIEHGAPDIGWDQHELKRGYIEKPSFAKSIQISTPPIEKMMRLKRNIRLNDVADPWGKLLSDKAADYFSQKGLFHTSTKQQHVEFHDEAGYPNELIRNLLAENGHKIARYEASKKWPKVTVDDFYDFLFDEPRSERSAARRNFRILDVLECFGEDISKHSKHEGPFGFYYGHEQYWSTFGSDITNLIDFSKLKPIGKLESYLADV